MKGFITGIIAGLVLAITSVGLAASQFDFEKHYRGIYCTGNKGSVICLKETGRGYATAINRNMVTVFRVETQKPVWTRYH